MSGTAGIYLFKVNTCKARSVCGIYSKLTKTTLERPHWRRSGVFCANFKHISYIVPVFPLLISNR